MPTPCRPKRRFQLGRLRVSHVAGCPRSSPRRNASVSWRCGWCRRAAPWLGSRSSVCLPCDSRAAAVVQLRRRCRSVGCARTLLWHAIRSARLCLSAPGRCRNEPTLLDRLTLLASTTLSLSQRLDRRGKSAAGLTESRGFRPGRFPPRIRNLFGRLPRLSRGY
jgi:hypothetical protein